MTSMAYENTAEIGALRIATQRKEVVFIESDVPDIATLIQGFAGREVVILDAGADGLEQIAAALAGRTGVDALHIVTHGAAGSASFGSLMLGTHNLAEHGEVLQLIGRSMAAGGDILLYGCDIGQGQGAGFVEQLALATGADVAASSDLTGHSGLGGDWELEVRSGNVESATVIDAATAALYQNVLAIASANIGFDDFNRFSNDGDRHDPAVDAVYQVNGSAAYQLIIDGAIASTSAYSGYSGVFAAPYALEDSVTLKFAAGQVFTATEIQIANWSTTSQDQTLVIKGYNAADQQVGATATHFLAENTTTGDYSGEIISLSGMTAITRLVITATSQGGKIEYLMIEGVNMVNIAPPAPSVVAVTSTTPNGGYKAGDTIALTVTFDAAVDVVTTGGVPYLGLETGSTDRVASYTGGSGSSTLSFSYTVQAGDTSADLDYIGATALALNGGTIKAAGSGSSAVLTLPAPGAAGSLGANKAIIIDTAAPTLAITSDKASLKAGETASITFTFSETPLGFDASDLVVSGGVLGPLSGSGLTRSATFTPVSNTNGGTASITVAAGTYTDAVGNSGGAGGAPALAFDTLVPTLTISSSAASLKAGETATITFTFSEDPGASFTWNGSSGDVVVSGGTLSAISGSGLTRSATFTPTASVNNGNASITVAAGAYTDAASNAGGAGTTPALSFDTLAPGAPGLPDLASASDGGSSSSDNITNAAALNFQGSAEAGATIRLYDGATLLATTSANGSGSWQADGIVLAEGAYTVTATATDAAGNTGAASSGLAVLVDRTAPAAPAAPALAPASDSGSSDSDGITSDDTPTFNGAAGSAAAGATILLYGSDGSTVIASTTAAGDGSWSATSSALAAGAHTVTAVAVDAAGNASAASGALALVIDRSAPATGVTSASFSNDTGTSDTDLVTTAAAQTIFGSLDAGLAPGERVEVSLDNGASWSAANMTAGTWSLEATLAGSATLQVRVTDAAGNSGAPLARAYVLDTTAPAAASTPDLAAASDSGASDSDNITGDTTPTFTGSAEAGATVTLYDGATAIGTAVATGGAWSITSSALDQGVHSITARATDAAGNQGAASSALDVTIDTQAPSTTVTGVSFSADTGDSATDLVTRTAAQTVSGTLSAPLAAGERVEVSFDNGAHWDLAVAATGDSAWTLAATLDSGANTLLARVVNAVDNASAAYQRTYTLDNVSPAVTVTSSAAQLKAGETATITFTFSEDPGASFTWDGAAGDVTVSGGSLGAISGSGLVRTAVFTPSASTGAGSAAISVGAGAFADLAGNLSAASNTAAFDYDTLAPNAPSVPVLDTDSGVSASDRITKDDTPSFSGTAELGATVSLFGTGGAVIGSATASAVDGTWSITTSALGNGTHSITAQARDAAGNSGAMSAAQTITIDTTAPTLAITSNTAQLKLGETANITFSFSEDPGASFTSAAIAVAGGTLGALSGSGLTRSATFTPAAGVDDALASISVAAGTYQDAAGNDGGAAATPVLRYDTLAPAAPSAPQLAVGSDTGTVGDAITQNRNPLIEGMAGANAAVSLYEGASLVGTTTADALGKWSIGAALTVGSHTLTVSQSDSAGNASPRSAAFVLQIDAPPVQPAPLVDGVPVQSSSVTLPGGLVGGAIRVPVITGGRVESEGKAEVADIPLATSGSVDLLLAQLPVGFGLSASGANVGGASAIDLLIASIKAATPGHAAPDQAHLTGNGQAFLAALEDDSLLVQTVNPVSVGVPAGPLALQGPGVLPGQQVALVIDTGAMASGGVIELRDVDFAAVIGSADILARGGVAMLSGDGASQRFTLEAGASSAVFAGGGNDTLGIALPAAPAAPAAQQGSLTTLHGGQAGDAAIFSGALADYDIEYHHGYLVVSSKAAPQAKALVVNVETLQFGNDSIAVDNADSLGTLASMYQSVLGRQADLFGIEYWADAIEAGATWGGVALRMIGSTEAGAVLNGDSAHDLALLYQALFDRPADSAGLAYWQDVMEQGASLEQVATSMVESIEMVGYRRAAGDWDFSV